jgi:hypothetical protein
MKLNHATKTHEKAQIVSIESLVPRGGFFFAVWFEGSALLSLLAKRGGSA